MEDRNEKKSAFGKAGMFNEASPLIFAMAKDLRKNMTDAEMVVWLYLKQGIEGCRFRRQHPVGIYIADFYCHKVKLIVEIDGSIHNREDVIEKDKVRADDLENWGYKLMRFTNEQVTNNMEVVLEKITEKVRELKAIKQ